MRYVLSSDAAGGYVLMAAAAAAMLVANSPLAAAYFHLLHIKIASMSVLHVINDGLMALFFLLVGLEIKREMIAGKMSSWSLRILPGAAALGGMVIPALIFLAVNARFPENHRGWAIPAATDIAFALGVLALLGSRVPTSLKLLLTAIAIIDDLGAIVIIAIAYTTHLSFADLGLAIAGIAALAALNRFGIRSLVPYLIIGSFVWYETLLSGVHATLAGVAVALTIPLSPDSDHHYSPLIRLEHALAPAISFVVVPLFGFANAGVSLKGVGPGILVETVPLGIALGLFFGKQIGVFGAIAAMVRFGFAAPPEGASWRQIWGLAILCGIGFTMSLFIAALAFGEGSPQDSDAKIGVLCGSIISAIAGYLLLSRTAKARR